MVFLERKLNEIGNELVFHIFIANFSVIYPFSKMGLEKCVT